MKKQFIITGMITLLGMMNLILTSNFSWGSGTQGSTIQIPYPISKEEYLEIINLLKQQIKENQNQIENAKKIHQSITGSKTQPIGENFSYYLPVSPSIYPETKTNYQTTSSGEFKNFFRDITIEEKRAGFKNLSHDKMREIINTRLKYNGIVEKAVSLQSFEDAANRFTQIVDFLENINKTKDLKEVFDLQTRIKTMSAMLQNEYTKLQMVRNLSDDEETLIEIQKHKLYRKIMSSDNKSVPKIRSDQ
ncbi:type IV secretion system protein [Bartonella sp. MU37NMGALS]|uniref:type IV secretion system protein n=1 Tax=Bartonella sp. MU37NMGALS TaxID=3243560 RepID=UPI0035CFEFD7